MNLPPERASESYPLLLKVLHTELEHTLGQKRSKKLPRTVHKIYYQQNHNRMEFSTAFRMAQNY